MTDINRATLFGRLGADPEIRTLDGGDRMASFRMATGERWTDKTTGEKRERTEWHAVVVFGPQVETVDKWLRKGRRVLVEGEIRTRKWQDQSGSDRWSTEIVLRGFTARLVLIDFETGGGAAQGQASAYGDLPGAGGGSGSGAGGGAPAGGFDDEIPFAPEMR